MSADAVQHEGPEGAVPARPESAEELNARLTPPPFSPEYRRGFPWVRPGDQAPGQTVDADGVEAGAVESGAVEPGAGVSAEVVPLVPVEVSGRAVSESAMRAVVEIDSAIASLQAMRAQLLAGIGGVAVEDAAAERLDPGVGLRDVAAELALMQRRSDRTLEADLNRAMAERERWPALLRAWGQARIHRGHVAVIAEIGGALQDAQARAAFEAALLPHAETMNPGRLRTIARRELERHLQQPLAARHVEARSRRKAWVTDVDDGMSLFQALVPTPLAHGIHDRVTQMAKAAAADDPRSFDQRRADAVCDLLLTGEPTDTALHGITAEVSIIIPAQLLTGDAGAVTGPRETSEPRPGEVAVARLADGTPIDPETALLLAVRASSWTRLFTDPLTGHVTAVDTYVPSTRLKKLLRARDQRCRWPGCNARAVRCDIDHTRAWAAGGTTDHANLAHLCRRHHTLKGAQLSRARRWKVRQRSPGVLEFTSPMGHTYIDQPPQTGPAFHDTSSPWGQPTGDAAPQGEQPF
ncbi:HNH endonuclease signature motif containing protein [Agrococcus baldri]|uniref:HNH nuclease domain-containing protein n=1 Tax=Agrococcus baldri TaxID=153730 RepID=A0AA87RH86_9MICO|nr:HNH endonuclease signature motif containing protein [Agrococcus baldri]GEK80529.1 hypothetical protein ABA31_18800 [Agrococcus baldri]